jgi:hypothetical protein
MRVQKSWELWPDFSLDPLRLVYLWSVPLNSLMWQWYCRLVFFFFGGGGASSRYFMLSSGLQNSPQLITSTSIKSVLYELYSTYGVIIYIYIFVQTLCPRLRSIWNQNVGLLTDLVWHITSLCAVYQNIWTRRIDLSTSVQFWIFLSQRQGFMQPLKLVSYVFTEYHKCLL